MKFLFCILALLGVTVLARVDHMSLLKLQQKAHLKVKGEREILIDKMFSSLSYHLQKRLTIGEAEAKKIIADEKLVAHSGTAATLLGCRGYKMDDFNDIDLWWPDIAKRIPQLTKKFKELKGYGGVVSASEGTPKWECNDIVGLTDKCCCEGATDGKKQTDSNSCPSGSGKDELYCPSLVKDGKKQELEIDIWDGQKPNYLSMSTKAFYRDYTYEVKSSDGQSIRTLGPLGTLTFKVLLLAGRKRDQKVTDYQDIGCLCKGLEAEIKRLRDNNGGQTGNIKMLGVAQKLQQAVNTVCKKEILTDNEYADKNSWDQYVEKRNDPNSEVRTAVFPEFTSEQQIQDPQWELQCSGAIAKYKMGINDAIVSNYKPDADQPTSGSLKSLRKK